MSSKKQVSSFQDEDYAENIKQFQLQVDKVKKLAKPGCSPQILNAALGSMLSLFDTLSLITSKRYIRASLWQKNRAFVRRSISKVLTVPF